MNAWDAGGSFPRTLVLGASGPIGQAIARRAADDHLPVWGSSRATFPRVDIRNPAEVDTALRTRAPAAVICLVRAPREATPDEARAYAGRIGDVVKQAGIHGVGRFVLASSAAVYGDLRAQPLSEDDPLDGGSIYALEKILAERAIEKFAGPGPLTQIALRVFNVFGPGCEGSLIEALASGRRPVLNVSPTYVRDYVHVDDVATAFLMAAKSRDVVGAVNIARGIAVTNVELAAACPGGFMVGDESAMSFSVANVERARGELGWQAQVDPIEYLRSPHAHA